MFGQGDYVMDAGLALVGSDAVYNTDSAGYAQGALAGRGFANLYWGPATASNGFVGASIIGNFGEALFTPMTLEDAAWNIGVDVRTYGLPGLVSSPTSAAVATGAAPIWNTAATGFGVAFSAAIQWAFAEDQGHRIAAVPVKVAAVR